jgi:protein transport protein DSL1/ZW10
VKALTAHASLAQSASDAVVTHGALSHLSRCRIEFLAFEDLVQQGKLSEAVGACEGLGNLLEQPPSPLDKAEVIGDLKVRWRPMAPLLSLTAFLAWNSEDSVR